MDLSAGSESTRRRRTRPLRAGFSHPPRRAPRPVSSPVVRARAARALTAPLRAFGAGLVRLVYPPQCAGCAAALGGDPALPLCPTCGSALDPADPAALAAHLGVPAPDGLDAAVAPFRYDADGPLGAVVHALKYGNRPRYGPPLGLRAAEAFVRAGLPAPDALVPLPIHAARRLERGYNQAEALADGAGAALGVPVRADLLRRARRTETQTHFGRSARRANVAHAFVADPASASLRLVLVDDVVTTGATAHAAAEALKAAGAVWVGLLAVGWTR